ncbi:methylated-DNA--[protein]-cysteine S-methyltransferase [Simonsiella muelleri]|uniref:Methylated-DNA--protein-cysteine methyltransferase n=1 Tax=Simonsiella muelleri ATCC 29453 TaxID=641147 RepID=V9HKQ7_9NEIS|nr:methylated-DNA--[protein]-cysteine S-methyltransferase [Simonsiella muelleri]AUX62416.1 cysteine methyltransferase [Simonsiella muelleri ATCC 29453]EFG30674.1 methylated-DNA-[protein]-cysteine S-methyltransferase [Simonsiella muelleri ATCC 29453]
MNTETEIAQYFNKLNFRQPETANTLHAQIVPTSLGEMLAICSATGLCLLEFVGQPRLEREIHQIAQAKRAAIVFQPHDLLKEVAQQVQSYFSGSLKNFSVPIDFVGTDFQQRVWHILQTIPYGKTISYAEQATKLGNPKAVRAVAAANGCNKISIIVPCHRVIGSNGTLTGYAGGLSRKQFLLDLESYAGCLKI